MFLQPDIIQEQPFIHADLAWLISGLSSFAPWRRQADQVGWPTDAVSSGHFNVSLS